MRRPGALNGWRPPRHRPFPLVIWSGLRDPNDCMGPCFFTIAGELEWDIFRSLAVGVEIQTVTTGQMQRHVRYVAAVPLEQLDVYEALSSAVACTNAEGGSYNEKTDIGFMVHCRFWRNDGKSHVVLDSTGNPRALEYNLLDYVDRIDIRASTALFGMSCFKDERSRTIPCRVFRQLWENAMDDETPSDSIREIRTFADEIRRALQRMRDSE